MTDLTTELLNAIELAKIGAGTKGYRSYPGCGVLYCGNHEGYPPDANFIDWGLARAVAIILNAAIRGQLVPRSEP